MAGIEGAKDFIRSALGELLTTPDRVARLLSALPPEERDEIDWRTKGSKDPKIVAAAYMDVHVGGASPR